MPEVVQITSGNFEGQIALVTFYPCTGGTITIGYVTIPYNYEADYYFGTYTLYFPEYNETCDFSIPCPTPTPTPTNTTTPTRTNPKLTPTRTPTKTATPTSTPVCFCYRIPNKTSTEGFIKYINCNGVFTQLIIDFNSTLSLCAPSNNFFISPNIDPNDIQLLGPCIDGKCPQIKPTQTPTPTKTPKSTEKVTPTPTKTGTPNKTPKLTRTPTQTPTPTGFPYINQCDVLYVTRSGQVYAFNPVTNTSLNLTSFFIGPSISSYNLDIAHTQDTLWLLGDGQIQEWFIQLFPFSAEFSRYITLPSTNIGDGLAVIDDTTLIISRYSDVPEIPNQILSLDITTDTGIPSSPLFFLPLGRFVTGDISYNSSDKLLITNQDGQGNTFVSQYDFTTTELDVEINITSTVASPAGLYSFDNNIFVINYNSIGQSYAMDLSYPYNITFETNINPRIKGSSQITDCFKQSFRIVPLLPTPTNTTTPTPTVTSCLTTTITIEATPPSSDQIVSLLQNIGNSVNSNQGALFHDPYNFNGTSPGNIYYAVVTTSLVWKNTSSNNGPLNRSGLWAANPSTFPVDTWLGFNVCINVPTTKTYWIGLGGDNNFRISVDGTDIVNTVNGPYDENVFAFIWWHVYPVTLDAGDHIIDLYGLNRHLYSTGPSAASFGCEIYDNTVDELINATSVNDLNIIFSSSGQTSATTVQSLTGDYTTSGYSCPDGYTFNPCDLTCFIEIDVCDPTPTPTSTPTSTKTPTPTPTKCCFNFDMYGGTQSGGSNFQVNYCDNTTSQIQVNSFTTYSTQYNSQLCAFSVTLLSGNGIIYTGSCGCVNPTPTPTPTNTCTPTKLPIFDDCGITGSGFTTNQETITNCEILLRGQSRIYKYDTNLPNESTELVIPNLTISPADITHTETRLFAQFGSVSNTAIDSIRVWNLNLSPFGATFLQDISLDFTIGYGIFALNDTTIIVSTGTTTSCFIEIDISDPSYIGVTDKFCLSSNRKVSNFSNFVLTDNGKLIVSNTYDDGLIPVSPITYHLTQFDYATGFEEQDVLVASDGNNNINNFVIIESNTQILIGKNNIYNIPLNSPYSPLTLFGNPTAISDIYGASQRYNVGCLPVELSPVSVGLCDALVRAEGRIYKYSFSSPNESEPLIIPNLSVSAGDLTHTEGKLFTQYKEGGPVGAYFNYLRVWDITLSPFVATYLEDINLNFYIGPGILAIDDLTIIATTGTTTSCFIEIDISDPNNVSVTPLFCLPTNRKVSYGSNFILNDNLKLIIPNFTSGVTSTFYISQYDYNTGDLEVDFEVSSPIVQNTGFVLLESSTQILAGYSNLYQIPNEPPYSPVSLFGNPNVAGSNMYGASQLLFAGCMNIDFEPQVLPTPTPTNTPTQTLTQTLTLTPTNTPTSTCARPLGGTNIKVVVRYFVGSSTINLGALGYNTSCNLYNNGFVNTPSAVFDTPIDMYIYPGISEGVNVAKVYPSAGTGCFCPGNFDLKYWINFEDSSVIPTTTSGVYWMSVDANCNATISACSMPFTINVIGSFNTSFSPYKISSENVNSKYYLYGSEGTEIIDSAYKSEGSLSFSANSGNTIANVLFDNNNSKLYFGSLGNEYIDVYDLSTSATSQIDLSSYNTTAWDMTFDQNYNILGITNGSQTVNGQVLFVDTTTDSIIGDISGVTSSYRGSITNDLSSVMATVSSTEDLIRFYVSSVPTTAGTVSISANTGGYRSIIYNTTNNYYYVLTFGERLEWLDMGGVGYLDNVSLSGYSGSNINSTMVYNSDNDRIYILNVKSDGNYGIITFDCSTNTILNFTDGLLTGGGIGAYEGGLYLDTLSYPYELLLWDKTKTNVTRLQIYE